ncbi:MAG: ABC transporter ATP-binding protein [Solirubrobacteraceae bacterium]|nr:ABC transporter ATP-binding protein [Solirubrobacteraceae bacterium]
MSAPTSPSAPGRVDGVRMTGLSRSFATPQGPVHAVRGVDLAIGVGETVALLGPNGAGKSTAIEMLLGLTTPDSGTVTVLGRDPSTAVAAGRVGAMLQTGSLIRNVHVREIVAMMAALHPGARDVDETLALTGLDGIARHWTHKLSGGQIQRVRFALAIAGDPELLVLDEPTVAMDVEGRRAFWATMRTLAERGTTILFATHHLEEADAYADRVVLLAHGRVVADGPPTEVKAVVGSRTIRATLPDVDPASLDRLPGVTASERRGDAVLLRCSDSDAALRALLADHPEARDLEVRGVGLEEAFVQLTVDREDDR